MRGRHWKAKMVALCLLATLGGCQGTQNWSGEVDPLLGGARLPSGPALPSLGRPSTPGAEDPRAGEVPPLRVGGTSTSTAALAVGPGSSDNTPAVPAVTIQVPRPQGSQAPVTPTNPIAPTAGFAVAPASTTGGLSYEQVQQALAARGVTEQHIETTGKPGEWHFWCVIPIPNDPSFRRNFEANAVGAGGLNAMRAVLEDIEQVR